MKRAIIYARVSGDDRGKDGRNLNGQLSMGREYALKRGYSIINELAEDDRGASGASFELEQLNRIREMAQKRDFDILIVREIDRLSRSLAKQLVVEEELKRAGVHIEYVLGEYPDTPEGTLNKNIKAVIAEYERLKINERMVRGRRLKVKAGSVLVAAHPPYGYKVVQQDGKYFLEVCEPEARIVRMIFDWYHSGGDEKKPLTIRNITRKLNQMEIPVTDHGVIQAKSGQWQHQTVRQILRNETYVGTWTYGKTRRGKKNTSDNYLFVEVPALVDRQVWEAIQKRLAQNSAHSSKSLKYDYLMQGHLTCKKSRKPLHARAHRYGDKVYKYYFDMEQKQRRCDCRPANAYKVDEIVWEWIKSLVSDPAAFESGLQDYQAEREREIAPIRERLQVIDDLLEQNQLQLNRLLDLYLDGSLKKEILVERKNRLELTIAALETEREKFASALSQVFLDKEQMENIRKFAEELQNGIEEADSDFASRRHIIEMLMVEGELAIESDTLVLHVNCRLGQKDLVVDDTATSGYSVPRAPPSYTPAPKCKAWSSRWWSVGATNPIPVSRPARVISTCCSGWAPSSHRRRSASRRRSSLCKNTTGTAYAGSAACCSTRPCSASPPSPGCLAPTRKTPPSRRIPCPRSWASPACRTAPIWQPSKPACTTNTRSRFPWSTGTGSTSCASPCKLITPRPISMPCYRR